MTLLSQITEDAEAIIVDGFSQGIIHIYGAESETLNAIFDNPHEVALDDRVTSSLPGILVKTSEAGNIDTDSSFTINGTTYYAMEIQPDDFGITKITLSEDE